MPELQLIARHTMAAGKEEEVLAALPKLGYIAPRLAGRVIETYDVVDA